MFKLDTNRAARPLRMLRALLASALLAVVAVPAGAFHFPWDQGHDTTNSNDPPPPGPCGTPECDPCNDGGTRSPVYVATGHCYWTDTDVVLRGRPYIGITRSFNSNDPVVGLFGNGWAIDFDVSLYPANSSGVQQRIYKAPNGKRFVFVRQADGSYRAPASRFETVVEGPGNVTMTSPDGARSVFALDGRLLQRFDSNSNGVSFSYDSAGRIVRMADDNGRFLAFTYNGSSLIDSVADHGGRLWRYAYDVSGNLLTVTDPLNGAMTYQYVAYRPSGDAFTYQLLTRVVDAAGVEIVGFTYSNGRVASYREGANTFTYTRPTSNTLLGGTVTRTDAMGARTTFAYSTQGLVTRDTDALNFSRSYTYDANGRKILEVDEAGGRWASTYDSTGRLLTRTNPLNQAMTIGYVGNEPRPAQITSPTGRLTSLQYDLRGNLAQLTDPNGAVTRLSWSAQGDPVSVVDATGATSTTVYSPIGLPLRVGDPLGRATTYEYDTLGRLIRRTNAAAQSSAFTYDALDRIITVTDPLGAVLTLQYDPAGRILSVRDKKGSTTLLAYDNFGRLIRETAPDGRIKSYTYRLDNLVSLITNSDNTTIAYDYDANKRLIRETADGVAITYAYNARGEMTQASVPGGTVSYTYDAAGRTLTETNNGRTITATRNAEGERTQTTLSAGGPTTQFGRDQRGLITQITSNAGTFVYTRDPLGRRTRLGLPNGSAASWAYDAAGQLQSLSHSGAFNADFQYTYDSAGRMLGIAGSDASWAYAYDSLGRLVSATRPNESYAYAYDAVGNITSNGARYDINHRLVEDSDKTYVYDARGNLVREQDKITSVAVVYTWNVRDQLTKVEYFAPPSTVASRTITFTYDAMGRRASKTDGGVQLIFVYEGYDLVATTRSGVTTTNTFGPGLDDPLATVGPLGTRFFHTDHLGSVIALSDAAVTTTRYRYDPYGRTTVTGEAPQASFAYTAREQDTDDLYYYRTRYYSTSTKRFLSEDRLGLSGGANLYGYADGNPISNTDPTGECPLCFWAAGQYARCVASCAAISAAANAITGGCAGAGDILGDCASDCLNPMNWGGKGRGVGKGAPKASAGPKGTGPKPNNGNGPKHGSDAHNDAIDNRIDDLRKDPGVSDIRKNQTQVDVDGNKVGNNRPDVQYNKDGCHNCVEYDTVPGNGQRHGEVIRSNDPNTKVELNDVPPKP